jgi:hypothetical protein
VIAAFLAFFGLSLGVMTASDVAVHPRVDLSFMPESFARRLGIRKEW